MTAIEYPLFTIRDGRSFRLRFSMRAIRALKAWGVPTTAPKDNEESWEQLHQQLAAVAYNEVDGEMVYADLKPGDVKAAYGDDPELWELKAIRTAIDAAVSFRMLSDEKSSQPGTAQQGS